MRELSDNEKLFKERLTSGLFKEKEDFELSEVTPEYIEELNRELGGKGGDESADLKN